MPLSSPADIGAEIAGDIQAIGVEPGTPVTADQLKAIWTAVVTRIYADLQANAGVAPGTFNVPGYGPVEGLGGPLE
jgi:hypothetical protein